MLQLSKESFSEKLNHRLEDKNFNGLLESLVSDPAINGNKPEECCQLDPRDGSMIVYAGQRANRPAQHGNPNVSKKNKCPICSGKLTQVIDCYPLSDGFTFISQNLFPVVLPDNTRPQEASQKSLYEDADHNGRSVFGFHLVQWSSSIHDRDWHNMPVQDIVINLKRLSILEDLLLKGGKGYMPPTPDKNLYGYFSVIKNFGAKAGASLQHGHQQIAYSNIMPQRSFNNLQFFGRHNRSVSDYLFSDNPANLTVEEMGSAKVVVPYFMRRPFNVFVLLNTEAQHFHQLEEKEFLSLAKSIQLVIRAFQTKFEEMQEEVSFNMAVHTGPGCKLYVEFYPIMQASGGFERIGLWICQQTPEVAAEELRHYSKAINLVKE